MSVKYNYVTKEVMLKAIADGKKIDWDELPDNFKGDSDIAIAAINAEGMEVIKKFNKGIISNKKFFLEHPYLNFYDYLTKELQDDLDIINKMVEVVGKEYYRLNAIDLTGRASEPEEQRFYYRNNYMKFLEKKLQNMSPYRQLARKVMYGGGFYTGYREEVALDRAVNDHIEDLEDRVHVSSQLKSTIQSLSKLFGLTKEEQDLFEEAAVNGPVDAPIMKVVSDKAKSIDNIEEVILQCVFDVYNNYDSSLEKYDRYAVNKNLQFLDVVLNSIGVEYNKRTLENDYNEMIDKLNKNERDYVETSVTQAVEEKKKQMESEELTAEQLLNQYSEIDEEFENNSDKTR